MHPSQITEKKKLALESVDVAGVGTLSYTADRVRYTV